MMQIAECQSRGRAEERRGRAASQLGKRDLGFQVEGFLVFNFLIFLGLQCKVVGWWQQIFTINMSCTIHHLVGIGPNYYVNLEASMARLINVDR